MTNEERDNIARDLENTDKFVKSLLKLCRSIDKGSPEVVFIAYTCNQLANQFYRLSKTLSEDMKSISVAEFKEKYDV